MDLLEKAKQAIATENDELCIKELTRRLRAVEIAEVALEEKKNYLIEFDAQKFLKYNRENRY